MILAAQISWSESMDAALQACVSGKSGDMSSINTVLGTVESTLSVLADSVLLEQPPVRRKKLEGLVCYSIMFLYT